MMILLKNKIIKNSFHKNALFSLLKNYNENGYFESELSSSALSTAIATFTLGIIDHKKYKKNILKGLRWLDANINSDGSWGDTINSLGNLTTTLLSWGCFKYFQYINFLKYNKIQKCEKWIFDRIGSIDFLNIKNSILKIYKKDMTFSVPILTMLSLVFEKCGEDSSCWKHIPRLPYELAVLPNSLFSLLNLKMVSYAMPALISMGMIRHKKNPCKNFISNFLRKIIEKKLIDKIIRMQPSTGGFLEAIPLTGFVMMSLFSSGINNIIIDDGLRFLNNSIREDGGYPIDTNLNTWVTTHSINVLSVDTNYKEFILKNKHQLSTWLLSQQNLSVHPFIASAPGGWGWSDLDGAVPDCDDTSGALIALYNLDKDNPDIIKSAGLGINWLLDIQNNDGGFPAFCKGWGKLPFDASCPDITAHALKALFKWKNKFSSKLNNKIINGVNKAVQYLAKTQNANGTWNPLWFGNQYTIDKQNPVYGTALVLTTLNELKDLKLNKIIKKASSWLCSAQNEDGGWGGDRGIKSSIEETSMAVTALSFNKDYYYFVKRGINWIIKNTNNFNIFKSSPIGLYFASLWYHEKLYPVFFSITALTAWNKMK